MGIRRTKNAIYSLAIAPALMYDIRVVIKSDTLNELRKNATYSRQYAAALIAHAERIEALIDADAAVADIGAGQAGVAEPSRVDVPVEPTRTETPTEPARTETPAENFRTETPVEVTRFDAPPMENPRIEAPVETPRVDVPPTTFPRLELPRPNRDLGVTQADAIKTALGMIGHPASLGEIFNTIKSQRMPVKLTSAENLRLVMSRSDDFESNESGQWQLKNGTPAPEFTDQANATAASGSGSSELAEFAAETRG